MVPTQGFRRHGVANYDRHDAGICPQDHDCRRANLGAGCFGAGGDFEPANEPACRTQADLFDGEHGLAAGGHICQDIAVMQLGEIVERLGVEDMWAMRTTHAYTKHLLESSLQSAAG